jgi:uncharacterized protein (TIGR03032 family)
MTNPTQTSEAPGKDKPAEALTAVKYEHTHSFAGLLEQMHATLLVSTYQAGKLLVIGIYQGALAFSFHSYEQVMGIAFRPGRIAIGTKRMIWFLRGAPELGPQIKPLGKYDSCFLTRSAHVTGEIHGHEMAWAGEELWIVNTLFSCLCTISEEFSFAPRWRPPFISFLAGEDRCHLNGLCMKDGKPKYVTAMAETDTGAGWRPNKATTGVIIDVPSGATVARGFAMPHSPRLHDGRLWVLDSGHGQIKTVDPANGKAETVAQMLGYTRGVAFYGPYAFVGLSKIRETSVFGGIPIAEKRDQLKCGVDVIDLRTGQSAARLEFQSGVDEIFDVQILPGIRLPAVSGAVPASDGQEPIWYVPQQRPF